MSGMIRKQIDRLMLMVQEGIEKHGFYVIGVGAGEINVPTFSYSIGQTVRDKPEILVIGLHPRTAHALIASTVELDVIPIGQEVQQIAVRFPVMFLEVEKEKAAEYVVQAENFYGEGFVKTVQLVWTDENSLFPWQEGFNEKFHEMQPVIGKLPV